MDHIANAPARLTSDEAERARIRRRLGQLARASRKAAPPQEKSSSGLAREDRMQVIRALRRVGWTYRAIGLVVGLSPQRVSQIDHSAASRHARARSA
jgi:hypothetical protein